MKKRFHRLDNIAQRQQHGQIADIALMTAMITACMAVISVLV